MSDGFRILSIDKARNVDVDTHNSALVQGYNGGGTPLFPLDHAALSRSQQRAMILSAADRKIARFPRISEDGTLCRGSSQCLFWDSTEGNAIDQLRWVVSTSTSAQAQGLGTGAQLNTSVTGPMGANNGVLLLSQRSFPFIGRSALIFRARVRFLAFGQKASHEAGFGAPTSATPLSGSGSNAVNGAHWRRDAEGNFYPVLAIYSPTIGAFEDLIYGTIVKAATMRQFTDFASYFYMEVQLEESRAIFRLTTHDGVLINEQSIDFPSSFGTSNAAATPPGHFFPEFGGSNIPSGGTFGATHVKVFHRIYAEAGVTALAVTSYFAAQTSVWSVDRLPNSDYQTNQSQIGNLQSSTQPANSGSITQNTQTANYSNSSAPSAASNSNVSIQYGTMGGQWQYNANIVALEVDQNLFGISMPASSQAGYGFMVTRISCSAFMTSATTNAAILQWFLALNSSSTSLSTAGVYPPRFKSIGIMSWLATTLGPASNDVVWEGKEWVEPGVRYLQIGFKSIGPSTTISAMRGTVSVEGYWE